MDDVGTDGTVLGDHDRTSHARPRHADVIAARAFFAKPGKLENSLECLPVLRN
jgi:hypothetical protein